MNHFVFTYWTIKSCAKPSQARPSQTKPRKAVLLYVLRIYYKLSIHHTFKHFMFYFLISWLSYRFSCGHWSSIHPFLLAKTKLKLKIGAIASRINKSRWSLHEKHVKKRVNRSQVKQVADTIIVIFSLMRHNIRYTTRTRNVM